LPAICTTFSSLTYTFCEQPTPQYGQTEVTTRSEVEGLVDSERLRAACAAAALTKGSEPVICR
jgi:hypothetical protein